MYTIFPGVRKYAESRGKESIPQPLDDVDLQYGPVCGLEQQQKRGRVGARPNHYFNYDADDDDDDTASAAHDKDNNVIFFFFQLRLAPTTTTTSKALCIYFSYV